jgi:hypothetical protein
MGPNWHEKIGYNCGRIIGYESAGNERGKEVQKIEVEKQTN